jgi:hypothetical protein
MLESRVFYIRLAQRMKRMDAVLLLKDEVRQRLMSLAEFYMPRDLCYVLIVQPESDFQTRDLDPR